MYSILLIQCSLVSHLVTGASLLLLLCPAQVRTVLHSIQCIHLVVCLEACIIRPSIIKCVVVVWQLRKAVKGC